MNFRQWNHYAFVINADTDQVMFYKMGSTLGLPIHPGIIRKFTIIYPWVRTVSLMEVLNKVTLTIFACTNGPYRPAR